MAKEYKDLEFLANGDMLEIKRLHNHHEMYGFHFAMASLRAVDYDKQLTQRWVVLEIRCKSTAKNRPVQRPISRQCSID